MNELFDQPREVHFLLPDWVAGYASGYRTTADLHAQMCFVIDAARENVARNTGGPFAAGLFERDSGHLVALGVNLVTTQRLSMLHAEMVAIALAQRKLGGYDLGAPGTPELQLVTSTEPCAMCFGAIPWSGVRRVVTGARDADARAIGFDEGPKPRRWIQALTDRGIEVVTGVERAAGRDVLNAYIARGGHIYNSREPD